MTPEQEQRFDKLYKILGYKDELSFEEIPPDIQLKQFISQLLKEQKEEILKEIEEGLPDGIDDFKRFPECNWNSALEEVKQLISKLKVK